MTQVARAMIKAQASILADMASDESRPKEERWASTAGAQALRDMDALEDWIDFELSDPDWNSTVADCLREVRFKIHSNRPTPGGGNEQD